MCNVQTVFIQAFHKPERDVVIKRREKANARYLTLCQGVETEPGSVQHSAEKRRMTAFTLGTYFMQVLG